MKLSRYSILDIGHWTCECPMSNIEYPANFTFLKYFRVVYIEMSRRYLTWEGTRIVAPSIAARWVHHYKPAFKKCTLKLCSTICPGCDGPNRLLSVQLICVGNRTLGDWVDAIQHAHCTLQLTTGGYMTYEAICIDELIASNRNIFLLRTQKTSYS